MAVRNTPFKALDGLATLVALFTLAGACTPPSVNPDGSVPQDHPTGINGMTQEVGVSDGTVWGADLFGGQVLRFDPDSGEISERYGFYEGACKADDVALMADDSVVVTCPYTGEVQQITSGGTAKLLTNAGPGVNPVVAEPGGTSVLVGYESDSTDKLRRVRLDGSVEVVATGLPAVNGFEFGADGLLYVPTGGFGGILGDGGLGRINTATGDFEQLSLSFTEAGKTGFDFACGVDVAADGRIFVAQCVNPAVYEVNPSTGEATLVGRSPLSIADNVLVMDDGRILLSGFNQPRLVVFTPDGSGGWSRSIQHVGL